MKQTLEETAHSFAESRSSGSLFPAYNPNSITQHSEVVSRFKVCIGKKVMYFD